jgi:hypothetical protein
LLGDDIVIANDKVAAKYKSIMNKLGVDISEAKSHVSKNTYEFAKRWIRNRVEISPLPLRGILNNYKNLNVVLMQLLNYLQKCNIKYKGNALELICELYNKLKIGGRFLNENSIYRICYKFYYSYRYSLGYATNDEMRSFLHSYLPEHIPVPRSELIPGFIRELLIGSLAFEVEKLSDSASKQLDAFIKYYKDKGLEDMSLLANHPFTHALYNQLKSKQDQLNKISNDTNNDLIDKIVHMRVEAVDKLVETVRDPYVKVSKLDKL